MKGIAVIFAALLACVVALPPSVVEQETEVAIREQKVITATIAGAIQTIRLAIRAAGLDPLNIPLINIVIAFPIRGIFEARLVKREIRSTGLSNIVINQLNFAVFSRRLTFAFEMPLIDSFIGDSRAEIVILNRLNLGVRSSGSLAVRKLAFAGTFRVGVGLSGVSIDDLELDFSLGGIDSDLSIAILGRDISDPVNNVLGNKIPDFLEENRETINKMLEMIVLLAVEFLL